MVAVSPLTKPMAALPGPRGWPLLGNLLQVDFEQFHRRLELWSEEFGPIYRIRLGPRPMVVVAEPDVIKRMFRERPDLFRRTRRLADAINEMRFTGVFSAEGDTWRRQRKIVAMALNTAHLKPFFPQLMRTCERLRQRWMRAAQRAETVDLCRDLMRFTVDVTTQLAFGIDVNTVETDGPVIQQQLDKVFPVLNWRINAPFAYWRLLRLPKDRELDRALIDLEAKVNVMIADVRRRMQDNPALYQEPTNFLEAIIAAKQAEDIEFSDADIFGNVCTLLLAGEDTTANTLAWAMNYFCEHPQHFARARREVDAVLGAHALPQTIEQLADLPFIEAFYNETMRLKPVAPLQGMEPLDDIEMLGYHVPRGTVVLMLTRQIALDEERFERAREFRPERWLQAQEERQGAHDVTAFVPFGSGPRFCPGRNLAVLEIRAVLALLCRNFDLERVHAQVDERLAFTMMPKDLRARVHLRSSNPGGVP